MVGNDGNNLILLFGMPRSGTTWVGKVFDSHPDVLYRHEPDSVYPMEGIPSQVDEEAFADLVEPIRQYASRLLSMSNPRVLAKQPLMPKRNIGPVRFQLHKASLFCALAAASLSFTLPVYNPAARLANERNRVVWKSVTGMGRLGAILRALPEARGILILRHPCGYVASQSRGLAGGRFGGLGPHKSRHSISAGLRQRLQQDYGMSDEELENLSGVQRLAWRWVITHDKTCSQVRGLSNYLTVWYDDLCREPITEYRRLFEFTGLAWTPETEAFLHQTTSVQDSSYYSIFKDPQLASMRWEQELNTDEVSSIMTIVQRSSLASRFDF